MTEAAEIRSALGRVLIVGGGRMGEAILAGLLNARALEPSDVIVANPGLAKRERLSSTYGIACVADATEAGSCDTCILAVKPQVMHDVLVSLTEGREFAPQRVISVAAGVKTAFLAEFFPASHVIRVMPNTPLTVGEGMVGISLGAGVPAEEGELASALFELMGKAVVVDEPLQDAVVALSGSGPAYFALVCRELAAAGEELGLPADLARELAIQTMVGTGALLTETGQSPEELIDAVSSPGGTTIAALDAMRAAGLPEALHEGARAAARRSEELS
ncbi:MAG: pyrroline-5-carboxylate reductase [Coriobacteriales bacterium]|jgi:pyrroline-5-carboxylate reductase